MVLPTISLLLLYWTLGFNPANNPQEFFQILLIGFLLIHNALGYGYFLSATFKTIETATSVAPLFSAPTLMFGGFFINSNSYPPSIGWIRYLSCVFYSFSAILRAQWERGPEAGREALAFLVGDIQYWNCVYALMILAFAWRVAAYFMLLWNMEKFQ